MKENIRMNHIHITSLPIRSPDVSQPLSNQKQCKETRKIYKRIHKNLQLNSKKCTTTTKKHTQQTNKQYPWSILS